MTLASEPPSATARREFQLRKAAALREIIEPGGDRSKKGSVDAPIAGLVARINRDPEIYTTSSCSGRAAVFAACGEEWLKSRRPSGPAPGREKEKGFAKKGDWVFVTHDAEDLKAAAPAILRYFADPAAAEKGPVTFKFEPFILALECVSLAAAQSVAALAREAGFRETGILAGGRYIVSVRCSIRFDVPIAAEGELLVSERYLRHLAALAREKFALNAARIRRFEQCFLRHRPPEPPPPPPPSPGWEPGGPGARVPEAAESAAGRGGGAPAANGRGLVALVGKVAAKRWKDALKGAGWLDKGRKAKVVHGRVALPVLPAAAALAAAGAGAPLPRALASLRAELGDDSIAVESSPDLLAARPPSSRNPAQRVREAVLAHLQAGPAGADAARLAAELPTKWERLGDLVLLPANCMRSPAWPETVWEVVAGALQCEKLGVQAAVAANGFRESRVELRWPPGADGLVQHRENGLVYEFDAARCMFSSGNVTEKARVATFRCQGETVVDLYAGIGYYTLPYLAHAGARHLFACEWNPVACAALRRNLELNGVAGSCTVLEGDNRRTCPRAVADRVNLGLLPSSRGGWATAVAALKPAGGRLHIHENVREDELAAWADGARRCVEDLARAAGREWEVAVLKVVKVKWYAPRVRHVVLDLACRGRPEPGLRSHPLPDV